MIVQKEIDENEIKNIINETVDLSGLENIPIIEGNLA